MLAVLKFVVILSAIGMIVFRLLIKFRTVTRFYDRKTIDIGIDFALIGYGIYILVTDFTDNG